MTLCFFLPICVPVYVWDEKWDVSIFGTMFRYVWSLHATFLVNSFAHMFGNRPYNRQVGAWMRSRPKNCEGLWHGLAYRARLTRYIFLCSKVKPTENAVVSFFALGEGWHNYHHSFPWDYKAAELGAYGLNSTTAFIELMAFFGLAYDLKTPKKELVDRTTMKKGDGTNSLWGHQRHWNIEVEHFFNASRWIKSENDDIRYQILFTERGWLARDRLSLAVISWLNWSWLRSWICMFAKMAGTGFAYLSRLIWNQMS